MSNRRPQIKSFVIALLLWITVLFPASSSAEVCFDDQTAGAMVVALEQARISEQQLTTQAGGNTELLQQAEILKTTIRLYEEQIVVYKSMVEMNAKLSETKDRMHQEQIKAAKPTFWENIQKYIVGGGVGALLVVILL